ncbi:MAG TPA: type II secretion system protein GspM [Bryobacteraceae bacterium]|nr:type II secretion system protein GspM [Bryobacteraceae bacterium]
MTLQKRDKRALVILGVAAAALIVWNYLLTRESATPVVSAAGSLPAAEKRLVRLRQTAALLPAREETLKAVRDQLALREKGLIQAETGPQAQAQLLQILRRLTAAQSIEVRTVEMGQVRTLGDDYGEVSVPVTFDCRIEQLLNLLADLTSQSEAVAASEVRIGVANEKEKMITVRLTVSGVVPRRLVPEKKGVARF